MVPEPLRQLLADLEAARLRRSLADTMAEIRRLDERHAETARRLLAAREKGTL